MAKFPTIPGYDIEDQLKSGGFGTTFLAMQQSLQRRCVIKILNHNDEEVVKRFINEARAVNAIRNPGIVQIYDIGTTAASEVYLAMEYIDKGSLWDRLGKTTTPTLPNNGFLFIIKQIVSVLKDIHEAGIFHRDLSPGNIMFASEPLLDTGERVKIIDFGLAKVPKGIQLGGVSPVSTSMTATFGTPGFMAPEAYQGVKAVTSACDVWSVGAIIYYALTRKLVDIDFTSHEAPQPLNQLNSAVPQWFSDMVEKMLTFKASARPSMEQIITTMDTHININTKRTRDNAVKVANNNTVKNEIDITSLLGSVGANIYIHARSQSNNHLPMTFQGLLVQVDETEKVITVKCAANPEINIPVQAVQCIWRHKSNVLCLAISGLFIGSMPSDWWYYSR